MGMKRLFAFSLTAVFLLSGAANAELLTWLAGDTANEADPNVLLDSSKHGNHALVGTNTSLTDDGKDGGGIDFGAGTSYFKMNAATWDRFDGIVDKQEFTIAFWMAGEESAAGPSNNSVFWFESPSNNGTSRGIQSHAPWSNGQVYIDIGGCCSGTERLNGAVERDFWDAETGDEWTHYAFTMNDAGDVDIYIDGEIILSRVGPTDDIGDFTAVWWGGAINGGNSFQGRMDDIVVADNWIDEDAVVTLWEDGPAAVWADDILGGDLPTNVLADAEPVAEQFQVGGTTIGEYFPPADSVRSFEDQVPTTLTLQVWLKNGHVPATQVTRLRSSKLALVLA